MLTMDNYLKASQPEWALVRRHKSEDIFGVQVMAHRFSLLIPLPNSLSKFKSITYRFVVVIRTRWRNVLNYSKSKRL